MRRVKRTAVVVKPKQPYIDWANGLEKDGAKMGEEYTPEHTIYLVEDITGYLVEVKEIVKPYYTFIFEEELNAWYRLESAWPQQRDFALFLAWFEVEVHSMILDLTRRPLKTEAYERY